MCLCIAIYKMLLDYAKSRNEETAEMSDVQEKEAEEIEFKVIVHEAYLRRGYIYKPPYKIEMISWSNKNFRKNVPDRRWSF